MPDKVVSGGQTGADRAALDWARRRGIPHGGWCPKGRRADDGPLLPVYELRETESSNYRQRTRLNVRDSDATLVLNLGELDGGSLETVRFAEKLGKPYLILQLDQLSPRDAADRIVAWLSSGAFKTLNVAGPREGKRPGAYAAATAALEACLA